MAKLGRKKHLSFVIVHLSIGIAKSNLDSMPNIHWAISRQRQMTNGKWSDLLNIASQAAAPAEPLLGEISAPHSHNGRAAGFHDDGRHVVPVRLLRDVDNPAVDAGRPDDLAPF